MNRNSVMRWAVAFALASVVLCARSEQLPVQERYDALIRAIDDQSGQSRKEKAAALGETYDALFPMHAFRQLEEVDDQALSTIFLSAANAVRLIGRPADLRQAEMAFSELLSRDIASERQFSHMQGAYIQMRMLDEARRFRAQHPSAELNPVPLVRESASLPPGQPTELAMSPDGQVLFRRPVDISGPVRIVVVAHPRCRYSRNAMLAIGADPVLSDAFGEVSKWIIPPGFRLDLAAVRRWNEEHPEMALTLAYKVEEWPQLDYWGTPTFYVFQNGELAAKVTGWPEEGRRDELLAALRQVGLPSPEG